MIESEKIFSEIGLRVRGQREKTDLTQEELAERVGLTRTSITHIESGRQRIQIDTLYAIAEALKVEPITLLPPSNAEGSVCQVCGTDYRQIYGELGAEIPQARRMKLPLKKRGGRHAQEMAAIMVCPNCQRLIKNHPELKIDELNGRYKRFPV
jgi:transcriptional regulator with XRE-family HTH domain